MLRTVQRGLLVLVLVGFLVSGTLMVQQGNVERMQKQWERHQVERFLGKICRTGCLSYIDCQKFLSSLNYTGMTSEITLEEYQREQDMKGKKYYYLISWEEMQKTMSEIEQCKVKNGSIIVLSINKSGRGWKEKTSYYGIVSGKE